MILIALIMRASVQGERCTDPSFYDHDDYSPHYSPLMGCFDGRNGRRWLNDLDEAPSIHGLDTSTTF